MKPELEIGSSAGNAKVYNLKYVGLNVVVRLKLFVVHQDSNWLPPLTGSRALAVFLPSLETRDSDEYQFGNTVTGSGGVPGSGEPTSQLPVEMPGITFLLRFLWDKPT